MASVEKRRPQAQDPWPVNRGGANHRRDGSVAQRLDGARVRCASRHPAGTTIACRRNTRFRSPLALNPHCCGQPERPIVGPEHKTESITAGRYRHLPRRVKAAPIGSDPLTSSDPSRAHEPADQLSLRVLDPHADARRAPHIERELRAAFSRHEPACLMNAQYQATAGLDLLHDWDGRDGRKRKNEEYHACRSHSLPVC